MFPSYGLQGKDEELNKSTPLSRAGTISRLPSGAMVNRSVRLSLYAERQVGCACNRMGVEKSALPNLRAEHWISPIRAVIG